MKNQNGFKKLGDLMLGQGFYIVLFLCVATIGISGYYLVKTATGGEEPVEPAAGSTSVILPDSEANGPDPVGTLPTVGADTQKDKPSLVTPPKQVQGESEAGNSAEQTVEAEPEPSRPAAVVYTWPVKGEVLRDFSVETLALDPTLGDWRTHGGLDIAASLGVDVLAMAPGTVSEVYEDGLMGTTVVINHGEGLTSTYCNLAGQTTVEPGDTVETGTVIGAVGDTAIAEVGLTSHLHLEAWKDGVRVDPMEYLPER